MRKLWQTTWQCAAVFLCIVAESSQLHWALATKPLMAGCYYTIFIILGFTWLFFYGLLTLLNRHCWPANWHFTWHFPPREAGMIAGSLAII